MTLRFARTAALCAPMFLGVVACSSTTEQAESVQQVDDLLARIERVQAESLVSKEVAHTALAKLQAIVAPEFAGDATKSYAALITDVERSEKQAATLLESVTPMTDSAETVFRRWTGDLESFGNTRLRQRSQARLEETRTRYLAVVRAAQAAQIAYDAFNADLGDHALFLGHDLNASAVAALRPEVTVLEEQIAELDRRFESCAAAAKEYVALSALHGQIEVEATPSNEQAVGSTSAPTRKRPLAPAKQRSTPSTPSEPAPAGDAAATTNGTPHAATTTPGGPSGG